jgi:hypothetical protein
MCSIFLNIVVILSILLSKAKKSGNTMKGGLTFAGGALICPAMLYGQKTTTPTLYNKIYNTGNYE